MGIADDGPVATSAQVTGTRQGNPLESHRPQHSRDIQGQPGTQQCCLKSVSAMTCRSGENQPNKEPRWLPYAASRRSLPLPACPVCQGSSGMGQSGPAWT